MILKELKLSETTCIGGYYISPELCDKMIESFESNSQIHERGTSSDYINGVHINTNIKDSYDMALPPNFNIHPYGEYLFNLQKCLEKYVEKYSYINNNEAFSINEWYNIQKYNPGGGFKTWHFEETGVGRRCLVFMTYLNNVSDGGGTEFLYQNLQVKAEKGLTLLWPAHWTHTHRGIVSSTETKYIVTGWYGFK